MTVYPECMIVSAKIWYFLYWIIVSAVQNAGVKLSTVQDSVESSLSLSRTALILTCYCPVLWLIHKYCNISYNSQKWEKLLLARERWTRDSLMGNIYLTNLVTLSTSLRGPSWAQPQLCLLPHPNLTRPILIIVFFFLYAFKVTFILFFYVITLNWNILSMVYFIYYFNRLFTHVQQYFKQQQCYLKCY